MYFINKTFFTGEIFIANIHEYKDNMNFDLDLFISREETNCLINVLGSCLFNDLKEQLEFDSEQKCFVLKPEIESKWEWLIYGHSYEKKGSCGCYCNCDTLNWPGIIFSTPIVINGQLKYSKQSFLAYWIYYQRAFSKNSHSTGTGEAINQTENAIMISNEFKRKQAFNRFLELIQFGKGCDISLYQFLNDHKSFFPGFCPTYYQPLNMFDI